MLVIPADMLLRRSRMLRAPPTAWLRHPGAHARWRRRCARSYGVVVYGRNSCEVGAGCPCPGRRVEVPEGGAMLEGDIHARGRETMSMSLPTPLRTAARCGALLSIVALALGFASAVPAQQPRVLKISHQFPASTGAEGDFRDQLAQKFARGRREAHQAAHSRSRSIRRARSSRPSRSSARCARARSTCRCSRSPTVAARCPR